MNTTGLIFDIKRFSVNDGPGIRTTVFFKGCPLSCRWCHNPESRSPKVEEVTITDILEGKEFKHKEDIGRSYTTGEIIREIEKEVIFYETSGGGVTFSGGEPLFQPEFLIALAAGCKKAGIHSCLDTCGECEPEIFMKVIPHVDLFLYDIKLTDNSKHREWTGRGNETIIENLKYLDNSGKDYILRIPLVPGVNLDKESGAGFLRLIKDLHFQRKEVHLLPYHSMGRHKLKKLQMKDLMDTDLKISESDFKWLVSDLQDAGYTVKIGG